MRILVASVLAGLLTACASTSTPQRAEERTLTRPPSQATAPRPVPPGLDPGEAALAESEGLEPAPPAAGGSARGDIVVPGQRERPVAPLRGEDPRSDQERAEHIRAWDRCVNSVQRRLEERVGGSASPVAATPDEYCSERLGMAGRSSIPDSWSPSR